MRGHTVFIHMKRCPIAMSLGKAVDKEGLSCIAGGSVKLYIPAEKGTHCGIRYRKDTKVRIKDVQILSFRVVYDMVYRDGEDYRKNM